ncbi:MAG: hypothetical protein KF723_07790 [Rhizobiaceae bacterium]|nr:hypothetical protein [Rhizobiaceae bacterium]
MTTSAAYTQRVTIAVVGLTGFLIFLIIAGITAWLAWSSYDRSQTWLHVTATVEKIDYLCDVEKKTGKDWKLVETVICEDAAATVAKNDGVFESWRYSEAEFATIAYEAGGQPQRVTVRSLIIATDRLAVGDSVPIVVDPANLTDVQRPFSSEDTDMLWRGAGIGAAIWGATLVLGIVIAGINRSRHEKRAAAQTLSMESAWGQQPAAAPPPAQAATAGPDVPQVAGWARFLRIVGLVLLIGATLFALLAVAGANGDREVVIGAGVIFAAGLVAWIVLRLIARAGGRRPGATLVAEPAKPRWGR